jgi:hypothetical protein
VTEAVTEPKQEAVSDIKTGRVPTEKEELLADLFFWL